MSVVVTHIHLDLDAVFSVLLLVLQGKANLEDVKFLPANTNMLPEHLSNATIVDHQLGLKGIGSALSDLPNARRVLGAKVVDEIDEQDRTGKAIPRIPLGELFSASKKGLRICGMRGEELDRELLKYWMVIACGLAAQEQDRKAAIQAADRIPTVDVGPYRFAVATDGIPPGSTVILAEELGIHGSVYSASYGMGVNRFPGVHAPDLTRLEPFLQESKLIQNPTTKQVEKQKWFVHPKGFLTCWGSKKAPRPTKLSTPPKGTPQSREEMIDLLQRVYGRD